jgi:protein-disulfide isomerase
MNAKKQQLLIIGGVVVAAVVLLIAAIAVSGNANVVALDYSTMSPTRTDDGAFIIGDPDAPITLIEFADFGCPHCQSYHPTIQRYIQEFVATNQSRFEYRFFPTAGGQTSVFTGQIAECIDEAQPGLFWQAYDKFFALAKAGRYFLDDASRSVVQELGLSYSEVLNCSTEADQVNVDVNFGTQRGVNGTPALMVRYGNGPAQWISFGGSTYDRGSVPFDVLAQVVAQAQVSPS